MEIYLLFSAVVPVIVSLVVKQWCDNVFLGAVKRSVISWHHGRRTNAMKATARVLIVALLHAGYYL